ncbi:MAG: GTP cyclohydrolase [Pseudomonadales bacterium]|nr:GTP cyclohydrolase [Pseudomonadales bacterium]
MDLNRQIEEWLRSRITNFTSNNRPFITLAYAQSWDGSITTRCGETLNFSCEESTRLTHQLRSLHDGILVGIGTVLSDDPQLTVREWSGPNPQPIVLDSQLRTPVSAKICQHPDKQCWILTVKSDSDTVIDHAEVIGIDGDGADQHDVPLDTAMNLLRERGINSLMVEGGATVITAFIRARLVDALVLTVAPRLVGGYRAIGDLQGADNNEQLTINPIHSAQAGEDFVIWGDLQYGGSSS